MATRKTKHKTEHRISRPVPTFGDRKDLARYVDQDEIKTGGRVSSAAFMPTDIDEYLSVNSNELEGIDEIATYFRNTFQNGDGSVAIACRKVVEFNLAARSAGLVIRESNNNASKWEFLDHTTYVNAYKHRPTKLSYSHCGVEFINSSSDELTIKKIARRLSGCRPHLFHNNEK